MWKCTVLFSSLVLIASAVSMGDRTNSQPIRPNRNDGGGGGLGRPADWTMSKANLVAEFYTNEPATAQRKSSTSVFNSNLRDRNYKSIFPFPFHIKNDNGNGNLAPHQISVPFQGHGKHVNVNGNVNLIASGTNYNQQSVNPPPGSGGSGGYATPFRPIKFPEQNQIVPHNKPDSGYPPNFRQRGPAQPPSSGYWESNRQNNHNQNQPITNGLRPPPQQPQQLYLPPQLTANQSPPQMQAQSPDPIPIPQPQNQAQQSQAQYPVPRNNVTFTPSQPIPAPPPNQNLQTPQFQPLSPQILDNYRKQAVYPTNQNQQSTEKPIVYVMSNSSSSNQLSAQTQYNVGDSNGTPPAFNIPPSDSFTNYENNPVISPFQPPQPNLNALSTESLSHVLADANAKAGEAMDKTIRFVIHKPEDENVVKNAILEDAQNRYEDVKFVQGPTLKVQRKETVYLPPKRKTVVYILLKEPQIDTDVEVMSPQEDDPVPEVYITYQKSDGHVKTKHYSPKPIKEGDMKKYLDLEAGSESYSGEESSLQPRFSKSTSVSLSTSTKTSKKSATISTLPSKQEPPASLPSKHEVSSRDLSNHKMSSEEDVNIPLLEKVSTAARNSTSTIKKTRSSPALPSPRRYPQRQPIQCPTVT
ncbi:unnamed protein product [Orchesella dallaii]|uniref:DUF243 domain-containing protein n=1 Tax=Orchesella dallaii TaxID=48710 RepID=A0ABP1RZT6_9HEXA